jgi:putative PIG3 family NAD(P)H quinone oxidoreductase
MDHCRRLPEGGPHAGKEVAAGEEGIVQAIVVRRPGDEEVLHLAELPSPIPGPGEVRIRVVATAVNRADLLQRQGRYPPPPGASEVLGLECAGEIVEVGEGVSPARRGERVMALLAGGGYAQEAVAPAGCALPAPPSLSWEEAAALPEAALTVFLTLFKLAGLRRGERVLVHGGGSGIGTTAIPMVREAGGEIVVTAGSWEKCRRCVELGAAAAICYRHEDFPQRVRELTGGAGVDIVLDHIGGPYLAGNLAALAEGGRLVVIGTMGGNQASIDLGLLLRKRLAVFGSTLRARPVREKEALAAAFWEAFGEAVAAGRVRPVIDSVYPLAQAAEAHRRMAASAHLGKIVLRVT